MSGTIELPIPDGYTADDVKRHHAALPKREPEPGQVAYRSWCTNLDNWKHETRFTQERWVAVETACRRGYVKADKIEAALANREACSAGANCQYAEGFSVGRSKLAQLIRKAMK